MAALKEGSPGWKAKLGLVSNPTAPAQPSSDDLLDDNTISQWQSLSPDRSLTREDARQIVENVSGFFSVLRRWPEPANQTPTSRTDGAGLDARADVSGDGARGAER
jgi:hypothetical protein